VKAIPLRAEVWRVDFEPVRGHEQGRTRPALIISNDVMNGSAAGLVTVVPLTTKSRPIRSFLKIDPPQGGLPQTSYIICDQVRTIARRGTERLSPLADADSRPALEARPRRGGTWASLPGPVQELSHPRRWKRAKLTWHTRDSNAEIAPLELPERLLF
jgi:mRNA interferase MazF